MELMEITASAATSCSTDGGPKSLVSTGRTGVDSGTASALYLYIVVANLPPTTSMYRQYTTVRPSVQTAGATLGDQDPLSVLERPVSLRVAGASRFPQSLAVEATPEFEDGQRPSLADVVAEALRDEPFSSDQDHPLQAVCEARHATSVVEQFVDYLRDESASAMDRSTLLRIASRVLPRADAVALASMGLKSVHSALREASVVVLVEFLDDESRRLLTNHLETETRPTLRRYIGRSLAS